MEQLTGAACEHFAYPNGDYGSREIATLEAAGYKTARTCDIGWNDHKTDPYRLKAFDSRQLFRGMVCNPLDGNPALFALCSPGGGDSWVESLKCENWIFWNPSRRPEHRSMGLENDVKLADRVSGFT